MDELQAAIDKVADAKIDPTTFPQNAPLQFRHAAVNLLNEIARLRYRMDGGDLAELDELDLNETFVINFDDLREFVAIFHAEGNSGATRPSPQCLSGPGRGRIPSGRSRPAD